MLGISGLYFSLQNSLPSLKSTVKHCSVLTGGREAHRYPWQNYWMRSAVNLHTHRQLRGRSAQSSVLLLGLSLQDTLQGRLLSAETSGV